MNRGSSRPRKMLVLAPAALGFAAALAVPAPVECAGGTTDPAELIQRAARHFEGAEYAQAAALFTEADQAASGRSLPAVAGLCQAALKLERYDDSIAAAERWVELAGTQAERAGGYHYLGIGWFWQGVRDRVEGLASGGSAGRADETVAGAESFRRAAQALRRAAQEISEGRSLTLLSLADALVQLGEYREALEVLDEYSAAGGDNRFAEDLRCWSRYAAERSPKVPRPGGGGVFTIGCGVEPPEEVSLPLSQVIKVLRSLQARGPMSLRLIIDDEGRVACARGLDDPGLRFDAAALGAIKQSRFKPAHVNGVPVPVYYDLTHRLVDRPPENLRSDSEPSALVGVTPPTSTELWSASAVPSPCQEDPKRGRHDDSIAAAERRIELATKPAERARAYHDLGLGLFERGLDELYPYRTVPGYPVARASGSRPCPLDRPAGTESLRRAAEAFRFAAAKGGRGRQIVLLDLADTLLRLGELGGASDLADRYAEASEVLGEYAAGGGKDPFADQLRCFIAFASGDAPGGAEAAGGRLHWHGIDGVRPPIKVFAAQPQYTERARKSRINGVVIVEAIVDEEGQVACARALTRLAEGLDAAAVESVEKWRFRPATFQGQPVAMIYNLTVNFSLQ